MNAPRELPPPTGQPVTSAQSGRRHRRMAVLGVTAGLLGGGAAGLVLGVPGLSSAASDSAALQDTDADTGTDAPADAPDAPDGVTRLREALQALVDDGTITAVQADEIAEHLASEGGFGGPARHGPGHHGNGPGHGPFGGGPRGGGRFDGEVVAELIGVEAEALRDALRDGQTIAELATANGVDPQTVIDALVGEVADHLAVDVENGRLTQDEADTKLADATERITDHVNNGRPGQA